MPQERFTASKLLHPKAGENKTANEANRKLLPSRGKTLEIIRIGEEFLAQEIQNSGLGDIDIIKDYRLPQTSKEVDFILAGKDPYTGTASFVLVEVKHWTSVDFWKDNPSLIITANSTHPRLNPVLELQGYCEYITRTNESITSPNQICGIVLFPRVYGQTPLASNGNIKVFTSQEQRELHSFLQSRLSATPRPESVDLLTNPPEKLNKKFIDVSWETMKGRSDFILLDEQHTAQLAVLNSVEKALQRNEKHVLTVTGGAGSGKSLVAITLLSELFKKNVPVIHATGSRALTATLRKVAGHGSKQTSNLFKYFNSFTTAGENQFDVLICDEAHRVRKTSENRYTQREYRTGRQQIDELISAARVSVFFLDETQAVRPGEIGSKELINSHARLKGIQVEHIPLTSQFRMHGSKQYEEWVTRLIGNKSETPIKWKEDQGFQLRIAETPQEMENQLQKKINEGYNARITSGYCWPWSKPNRDKGLVPDIHIREWRRPWSNMSDRWLPGAPPHSLWASSEEGFNQIGNVYTSQGLDYDWSGVILGPDLVFRNGKISTRPSENCDPALRNTSDAQKEILIRNAYKVLLTRGMVGTILHSTDPETNSFLAKLINSKSR